MVEKIPNCYSSLFNHMIYEFKKGIRPLFLHTVHTDCIERMILRLKKNGIDYFCLYVNQIKVNIFFGKKECIKIIRHFKIKSLRALTPEQDFILGILLGYNSIIQCERYIKKVRSKQIKDFSQIPDNRIMILE